MTCTAAMTYVATETRKPAYPCDICGHEVQTGERVRVSDNGLSVEHDSCAWGWMRRNFGREGLAK